MDDPTDSNNPSQPGGSAGDKEVSNAKQALNKAKLTVLSRPVSYEDYYHLLGCYPYLEISHPEATHYPNTPPRVVESSVGWPIHLHDELIVSSQSRLLALLETGVDLSDAGIETELSQALQEKRERIRAQASGDAAALRRVEDSRQLSPRKPVGTPVRQLFHTAMEMVAHAKQQKWPGVRIVRGYYPMQRAAWIACEKSALPCQGFEASAEDQVVKSWVEQLSPRTFEAPSLRVR